MSSIHKSLTKVEKQLFFNEFDSNKEDCKLEPHEFFGEYDVITLEKHFVLLDTNSPCSNESIHRVPHLKTMVISNPLLLDFGVDDITYEIESPYISGFDSLQPCLDMEEVVFPQSIDPLVHVENIVDDNAKLTKLHHTLGVDGMLTYSNLKEYVICEVTRYLLKMFLHLHFFPRKVLLMILITRKYLLRHLVARRWLWQVLNQ